jgi:hypothetical protein
LLFLEIKIHSVIFTDKAPGPAISQCLNPNYLVVPELLGLVDDEPLELEPLPVELSLLPLLPVPILVLGQPAELLVPVAPLVVAQSALAPFAALPLPVEPLPVELPLLPILSLEPLLPYAPPVPLLPVLPLP